MHEPKNYGWNRASNIDNLLNLHYLHNIVRMLHPETKLMGNVTCINERINSYRSLDEFFREQIT
jgi:hypothetical protein